MVVDGNHQFQLGDASQDRVFQVDHGGIIGVMFGVLFDLVESVAEGANKNGSLSLHIFLQMQNAACVFACRADAA
jgi:hypothetical protein